MLRECKSETCSLVRCALSHRVYLKGELQRADMCQVGQSSGVWLQELRRQGQQIRRSGGARLTSRSGSAPSWAYSTAAFHLRTMTAAPVSCQPTSQYCWMALHRPLHVSLRAKICHHRTLWQSDVLPNFSVKR